MFVAVLIGSWGCPNNQFGVYKRPWWSTSRALTGQRPNMRCVDISKRNYFSNHVFKQRGKIFVAEVKNSEKALMTRVVWPPEGNEDKMWAKSIPQRSWSRSIAQSDQVWSALVNLGKGKISNTLKHVVVLDALWKSNCGNLTIKLLTDGPRIIASCWEFTMCTLV